MNIDTWMPVIAALSGQRTPAPTSWPASTVHRIEVSFERPVRALAVPPVLVDEEDQKASPGDAW